MPAKNIPWTESACQSDQWRGETDETSQGERAAGRYKQSYQSQTLPSPGHVRPASL